MNAVVIHAEPMVVSVDMPAPKVVTKKVGTFCRVDLMDVAWVTTALSVGGNSLSAVPNNLIKDGVLAGV